MDLVDRSLARPGGERVASGARPAFRDHVPAVDQPAELAQRRGYGHVRLRSHLRDRCPSFAACRKVMHRLEHERSAGFHGPGFRRWLIGRPGAWIGRSFDRDDVILSEPRHYDVIWADCVTITSL